MPLLSFTLFASQPPAACGQPFVRKRSRVGRLAAVLWLGCLAPIACGSSPSSSSAASSDCNVTLPASCPSPAPSYATQVAPIFADRCVSCHGGSNQESGIDLSAYASVYANREPVLAQVYNCSMPLAGAPSLSAAQTNTVLSWLVCEAPNN